MKVGANFRSDWLAGAALLSAEADACARHNDHQANRNHGSLLFLLLKLFSLSSFSCLILSSAVYIPSTSDPHHVLLLQPKKQLTTDNMAARPGEECVATQ